MIKEEVIQKAYGKYYNKCKNANIDQDGWTCSSALRISTNEVGTVIPCDCEVRTSTWISTSTTWYRPISLRGIENNNGWIKIESENDLPKDEREGYETGKFEDNEFYIDQFRVSASRVKNLWGWGKITHFKPVDRTKPIY